MTSLSQIDLHPHSNYAPLSDAKGGAINELLALGCKLYYQKGKERVYMDPQVKPGDVIPGNRALRAPNLCDSVGLNVGTLPAGVGIVDLDTPCFTMPLKEALENEDEISIEKTLSGRLHIWGRGLNKGTPRNGLSVAGLRLEYFTRWGLSILGPGRSLLRWVSMGR